ncbi:MAG: alpha/beta hydrolase [Thermoanaerobaculia bacterium]|nr:alpha/beta hydrolase [Thermoanaerobaculia bacterium]
MPIDPGIQAFVDIQAQAGIPPIQEQTVGMAREGYLALAAMVGRGPEVATEDRTLPGPAGDIPVRVYTPTGEGPYPTLVYYHGGGFVIGDLDTHDQVCRTLCDRAGCLVVSVDYRLAPEHPFPAGVDDCWAALEWVAAHAAELGGDPARLAVGGDSAGGNLSAVMTLLARERGGPRLVHQLLIYPGTDLAMSMPSIAENADGPILTRDHIVWFLDHYMSGQDARDDWRASPLAAPSHADLPPALVLTAEYDPIRDEGEAYAAKLEAAGVDTTLRRYDGLVHAFFQLGPLSPAAQAAIDETCEHLRRAMA